MLNSFRSFSSSFFVKILMGVLVVSFALWGVGDMLRDSGNNTPVATVGGVKISQQRFATALRSETESLREMMGSKYSPELAAGMQLPQRVLQQLVQQSLLALESKSIGIVPSDADILRRITSNPVFADAQGTFSKERFQRILSSMGMPEKKYIETLRSDVASGELSRVLSIPVFQPEIAARTLYEARKQQRTATLYAITPTLTKSIASPNDEQLDAYYKAHAQEFTVPEFRTLSYAVITPKDIPQDANVSEDEAAQKYINKIEDALAGGSTLQEVAAQFKLKVQSAGTLNQAGKTADGKQASLPPYDKFLSAAFSADEKSESQLLPIKGGGFYIVRVESIAPEHVRPLAEVKAAVADGWQKQERAQALGNIARDIADKFKTPEGRKEAIAQYHLSGAPSGNLKRDDSMGTLPPMLSEDIFARPVGQATGAFMAKNGDYLIAQVDAVIPAAMPDKASSSYGEFIRQMRAGIAKDQKSEIAEEFFIYLENKFPVTINEGALAAMTAQP